MNARLRRSVQEQQARPLPAGTELDANFSLGVAESEHCFAVSLYVKLRTNLTVLVD